MQQTSFHCAPVLLIGFNRPDFMRAQIEAVRPARPARLYIAVDGPRENRPDEAAKCAAVRDCAKQVDWSCEVKTLFRERNLGCKLGVSGAVTWFFENELEGIVLEDDCCPSTDFLRFATEMLARYREDERVGLVAGFNAFNLQSDLTVSYHFSEHLDIWGWASWRRVWTKYSVTMARYEKDAERLIGESKMLPYAQMFMLKGLHAVRMGLDTWDFQFSLMFLSEGYLAVQPRERLVLNAGLRDANATHTGGYIYYADRFSRLGKLEFPLVHPAEVVCDEWADRRRERMEGAILPRGLTWLGAKMPRLCPFLTAVGHAVERLAPVFMRWP